MRRAISISLGFLLSVAAPERAPAIDSPSGTPAAVSKNRGPGTARMAKRLEELAAAVDPMRSTFFSAERAARLRLALDDHPSLDRAFELLPQFGTELLNSGESEPALHVFESLEELARQHNPAFLKDNGRLVQLFRALCFLRIGEQENCLTMHNADSCLLPLRGGGIHRRPRGSRLAIEVLDPMFQKNPQDLEARWLLNLAYMTLGEYPEKVPPAALIPPRAFADEYDIGRFRNVAPEIGLDVNELSGGSIVDDFDGDGFLDVITSSIGRRDPLRFFRNNGDGTFTERADEAGLTGETGGLNLIQADYNNDGRLDFLVLRGAWLGAMGRLPCSLMRNNGDGTFEDVTEAAGLLRFHPTQTAVWFDYNNDGWLDLFIGNESSTSEPSPSELFRSNRDGTFTEVAATAGVAVKAFVKGAVGGDYNNDGRPDLYLSVLGASNILLRNDGPLNGADPRDGAWKFTDVTEAAGVAEPRHSFPTWFFDYDNDGWLDLMVTGYHVSDVGEIAADYLGLPHHAELPRLYHNQHDGTFLDVTRETGLACVLHAMGANCGDLDNDGYLDFYVGTGAPDLAMLLPNRMFRNVGGKRFQEVTTSGGFGHLQKGHGVSFADIDNDGDQDVHEDMGGAYSGDTAHNVLYENPGHPNHWITLKLRGTTSNRDALGARIKVIVSTPAGDRAIFRTVSSGASFGANPLRQEIGLGQATAIRVITIQWPGGSGPQNLTGVGLDHFYEIQEGDNRARPLPLKSFKLGGRRIAAGVADDATVAKP